MNTSVVEFVEVEIGTELDDEGKGQSLESPPAVLIDEKQANKEESEDKPVSKYCFTKADIFQFFSDYWRELRRYDAIIALLAAWGVFALPDKRFKARRRVRVMALVTQVFLVIGITLQLSCFEEEVTSSAARCIMTIIFVTIPTEIFNLLWFRLSYTDGEFREKSEKATTEGKVCTSCLLWTMQVTGVGLGVVWGLVLLIYAVIFFALGLQTTRYCSERHRAAIIGDIMIYQFGITPVLMSLPYWREQGKWLALVGPLGPVIGLFKHVRQFGLHPRPPEEEEAEETVPTASPTSSKKDVTSQDATDLEQGKAELDTFIVGKPTASPSYEAIEVEDNDRDTEDDSATTGIVLGVVIESKKNQQDDTTDNHHVDPTESIVPGTVIEVGCSGTTDVDIATNIEKTSEETVVVQQGVVVAIGQVPSTTSNDEVVAVVGTPVSRDV